MKIRFFLLGIGFSVALAAMGQTSSQPSSQTQTPPVTSTTPANQVGNGAQTKSGTPAPSATTSPAGQVNPTGSAQAPQTTTPSTPPTGGVAGAASSSATQSSPIEPSSTGVAAVSDSDLEGQIQNALNKEPTLTGDSTHVTVTPDTIELSGNVNTSKEKLTATRIVQSYAGSKKVLNHLAIGGKGSPSAQQQENPANTTNPASTTNPTTNPEPNKGSRRPPLR
ncbi:MAG TPA: BON domain-containing protein [Candidatus Angelobacter sp.]|nr:BON domain-containing protein [Candidatus Angelobacter sp.]